MASRKRKPLTLRERLSILAVVDRDPKRKRIDIAKGLRLPASTVNTVVSKRKQIEENALVFGAATKQARGAKHGELEDALLKWFKQARASGVRPWRLHTSWASRISQLRTAGWTDFGFAMASRTAK
ncbi:hypothetical protein HPB47_020496 [Ixodes persulcatus]|uniref:Uncharacterized protein n=1 Tax=Ixodes persulcatus TaxID=34615 RepID=A0AC60QF93_IXOPE|nr:hypothetical protein HPB47_020496 [Ixodes persulcatus]